MDYVKRIRDLREDHDLNQTQVAEVLGIKQVVYSRYELGKNLMPIYHLISLAKYYNVSLDYLCGLASDPTPPKRSIYASPKESILESQAKGL